MRTQLNVRVAKHVKERVAKDRKSMGKTNDVIVEVALEDFFTRHKPEQRAVFYRNHYRSPYARC